MGAFIRCSVKEELAETLRRHGGQRFEANGVSQLHYYSWAKKSGEELAQGEVEEKVVLVVVVEEEEAG